MFKVSGKVNMKNRIRILATSDIHGMIYPYRYADGLSADHGTAKLKSAIDLLRDENTVLVDNGDVLQGSSLQFYHYLNNPQEVSPITVSLNAMHYDYVNLGNHDFDFGEDAVMTHINALNCPCITANIMHRGKPLCVSYAVREVAGKKIALFGVVTHYVKKWQHKKDIRHFHFKDAFQTASKTVELIRRLEKPDYVIGLYHGGFERDINTGIAVDELTGENQAYMILKEVPGLDVLIAGHTHNSLCGKKFDTVYAQPGKNGEEIACVDIYTDTREISARILKVDTEPDEAMLELTKQSEQQCQEWLDTPLATTAMNLRIEDQLQARLYKSQVVTLINRIMLESSGADLASSPLFTDAAGFRSEITMRDLVNTYTFPNTLVVKQISGRILRAYLEKCAEYWTIDQGQITVSPSFLVPKKKPYNYDMVDGIEYTIRVSNDIGHRVIALTKDGSEIDDDMELTICISSYRASGGGDFTMLRDTPTVREIRTGMVELIARWLAEHKTIEFEPVNNITVIR